MHKILAFSSLILCLLLVLPIQVFAHDLGVLSANLSLGHTTNNIHNYRFEVWVSENSAYQVSAPALPAHCQLQDRLQNRKEVDTVLYTFTCHEPLTVDDQLFLYWPVTGVLVTGSLNERPAVSVLSLASDGVISVDMQAFTNLKSSNLDAAKRYFNFGVTHIASGFDHLLFVWAIFLLIHRKQDLLKAITAFTLAHSITLALSYFEIIKLTAGPVEAAIALSIVMLAYEYFRLKKSSQTLSRTASDNKLKAWVMPGCFGLLHGFGFAGALSDLGLNQENISSALLFFNLGVEAGQLIFIGFLIILQFIVNHLMSKKSRANLTASIAYGLGGIGMYWFIERTIQVFGLSIV